MYKIGNVIRMRQPTQSQIESLHEKENIKSIINLRGENPNEYWYFS